jgi:hypothetical protein
MLYESTSDRVSPRSEAEVPDKTAVNKTCRCESPHVDSLVTHAAKPLSAASSLSLFYSPALKDLSSFVICLSLCMPKSSRVLCAHGPWHCARPLA